MRRLTDEGTLEKQGLPGRQSDHAIAASAPSAAADAASGRAATTIKPGADATTHPAHTRRRKPRRKPNRLAPRTASSARATGNATS